MTTTKQILTVAIGIEFYGPLSGHYIWHNGSLEGDFLVTTAFVVPIALLLLVWFWITGK
jgi:hypothetical protein